MSNVATLAGHVHVEDYAIIGGLQPCINFPHIGAHCIIGGASASGQRRASLYLASGNHAKLFGLNLVGLKRRNFSEKTIKALKDAYRIIFRSNLLLEAALKKAQEEVEDIPEVGHFIKFIQESKRGTCR